MIDPVSFARWTNALAWLIGIAGMTTAVFLAPVDRSPPQSRRSEQTPPDPVDIPNPRVDSMRLIALQTNPFRPDRAPSARRFGSPVAEAASVSRGLRQDTAGIRLKGILLGDPDLAILEVQDGPGEFRDVLLAPGETVGSTTLVSIENGEVVLRREEVQWSLSAAGVGR